MGDLKAEMRKQQAAKRGKLHSANADAGARLVAGAGAVLDFAQKRLNAPPDIEELCIAGYVPIRSEIDPMPLLEACAKAGCATCLPTTPKAGAPLVFRTWQIGAPLVEGLYGTSEPPRDAPILTPNVLLVPLLAFDAAGYRLGYGGGFYDRTLAGLRPRGVVAIGIAYAGQEIPQVPRQSHDAPLDGIVTESGITASGVTERQV